MSAKSVKKLTLKDFYEGNANLLVKFMRLGPGWERGHIIDKDDVDQHSVPGDPIDVQRWLNIDAVEFTDEDATKVSPPIGPKNLMPAPDSEKSVDHLPPAQQPASKQIEIGSPQRPITAADRVAATKVPVRSTSRLKSGTKSIAVKKLPPVEPEPVEPEDPEASGLYVETDTIEPEAT